MPWYDYQCEKCGAVFEVQRAMGEDGKVKCRACGSTRTTKIYSAAPVFFKGSGFYVTDSSGRSKESLLNSPAESAGAPSSGDSTAKESAAKDKGSKDKGSKKSELRTA